MSLNLFYLMVLTIFVPFFVLAEENASPNKISTIKEIKSYCLDFNWKTSGEFAEPGTWKNADPEKHVAWYKTIGANVIQTFIVSCNGYAWYKNGIVPEQPGLKHDFLRDVVKLGHQEGMLVMGYLCIAANTRWGKENPELSYGTPSAYHIPYTDEYLAYLSSVITDAVKTTGIDGFMIDWLWQPKRLSTNGLWLESEKKLYQQLMNEPFPGETKITKAQLLAYDRKAIDRCWKTIRKAAKEANPNCIIWLTTNKMKAAEVVNSDMYKETDWIMSESGRLDEIEAVRPMVGKDTKLITCFADWNKQDASKLVPEALAAGVGLYGFAKPMGDTGLIDLNNLLPKQLSELSGNDKNIATLARAYNGKSIYASWVNGSFTEPASIPNFKIEFKKRSRGWQDTAKISTEGAEHLISIRTPYSSGRAQLTRNGEQWPETIKIQLSRRNADTPGPTHFRIANGKIGATVIQLDKIKIIAGEMAGGLDLPEVWTAATFLNSGNPAVPVKLETFNTAIKPDFIELTIPALILENNPQTITFEWCNGDKVR